MIKIHYILLLVKMLWLITNQTIKKKIKEEILKPFRNSNDIFNSSNNSHLEQEKNPNIILNNKISNNISFLNVEENDNINNNKNVNINENLFNNIPKKITKKNSLNDYNSELREILVKEIPNKI